MNVLKLDLIEDISPKDPTKCEMLAFSGDAGYQVPATDFLREIRQYIAERIEADEAKRQQHFDRQIRFAAEQQCAFIILEDAAKVDELGSGLADRDPSTFAEAARAAGFDVTADIEAIRRQAQIGIAAVEGERAARELAEQERIEAEQKQKDKEREAELERAALEKGKRLAEQEAEDFKIRSDPKWILRRAQAKNKRGRELRSLRDAELARARQKATADFLTRDHLRQFNKLLGR